MKLSGPQATIAAAIIAVLGIIIGAFLNPLATKLINQHEPTPTSTPIPQSVTIEQFPYTIYSFDGESDESVDCCVGRAYFELANTITHSFAYGLNYILPDSSSKPGYAGYAFVFSTSQDLSAYESIQFSIVFHDQANKADVNFEDITRRKVPYHIVGNGQAETKVIVPLSYFTGIDFKAIRSIGFQVDSSVTSGNHTFYVKDIRLMKQ